MWRMVGGCIASGDLHNIVVWGGLVPCGGKYGGSECVLGNLQISALYLTTVRLARLCMRAVPPPPPVLESKGVTWDDPDMLQCGTESAEQYEEKL